MKMKLRIVKRVLAWLLAMVMAVSVMPSAIFAGGGAAWRAGAARMMGAPQMTSPAALALSPLAAGAPVLDVNDPPRALREADGEVEFYFFTTDVGWFWWVLAPSGAVAPPPNPIQVINGHVGVPGAIASGNKALEFFTGFKYWGHETITFEGKAEQGYEIYFVFAGSETDLANLSEVHTAEVLPNLPFIVVPGAHQLTVEKGYSASPVAQSTIRTNSNGVEDIEATVPAAASTAGWEVALGGLPKDADDEDIPFLDFGKTITLTVTPPLGLPRGTHTVTVTLKGTVGMEVDYVTVPTTVTTEIPVTFTVTDQNRLFFRQVNNTWNLYYGDNEAGSTLYTEQMGLWDVDSPTATLTLHHGFTFENDDDSGALNITGNNAILEVNGEVNLTSAGTQGIWSRNLTIQGNGTLNTKGSSYGLTTAGTLTIAGNVNVNATGTHATESEGVYVADAIVITSGILTASGNRRAIRFTTTSPHNFTVPAGLVYTVATDAAGTQNTVTGTSNGTFVINANHKYAQLTNQFVPVSGISGIPTLIAAGTTFNLAATVEPSNATNQAIIWEVMSAGGTGATITGNTFSTSNAGSAITIRATIANGAAAGTDYVQEFMVSAGTPVDYTLRFWPDPSSPGAPWRLYAGSVDTPYTGNANMWEIRDDNTLLLKNGFTFVTTADTALLAANNAVIEVESEGFAWIVTTTNAPTARGIGSGEAGGSLTIKGNGGLFVSVSGDSALGSGGINVAGSLTIAENVHVQATSNGTGLNSFGILAGALHFDGGRITVRGNSRAISNAIGGGDITVSSGLEYRVSTNASGTPITASGTSDGTFVIDSTHKFAQIITPFIPVTGITGIPESIQPGVPLTLTGTVAPANATFQNIVWSVVDAGTTGAQITGNTLSATGPGTATIRATVANGMAAGTAYQQDFDIAVMYDFGLRFRQLTAGGPWGLYVGDTNTPYDGNTGLWKITENVLALEDGFIFLTTAETALDIDGDAVINIPDGTVTIGSARTAGNSEGINAGGNLTIQGNGTLNVEAATGHVVNTAYVIRARENLVIAGNVHVNATGSHSAGASAGVRVDNAKFTMTGGSLTASGITMAILPSDIFFIFRIPAGITYTVSGDLTGLPVSARGISGSGDDAFVIDTSHKYAKLEYSPPPPTLITAAPLTGITFPVAGAAPSTGINNGTEFSAALTWVGNPAKFDYDTVYTAQITLTAAGGFTFDGGFMDGEALGDFRKINNSADPLPATWVSNNGTTLVFTVAFPATDEDTGGPPPIVVTYDVVSGNGALTATLNGNWIDSGTTVTSGSTVVFTATPNPGYRVKEWWRNNTVVAGHTENSFTITDIQAAVHVTVEFEAIPYTGTLYFRNNALRIADTDTAAEYPGRGTVWNAANDTLTFIKDFSYISTDSTAMVFDTYDDAVLVIEDGVTVTIVSADTHSSDSIGIFAYEYLRISGSGTLNVTSGAAADDSRGISTFRLTVDGATVNATGGALDGDSYGVYAYDLTINGGMLTATGGAATNRSSYGVNIYTTLTITGGTLTATGQSQAMYIGGGKGFHVPNGFTYRAEIRGEGSVTVRQGTSNGSFLIDDRFQYARITFGTPTLITAAPITGVTSPVAGAAPSTGINNGTGFTAALAWVGNPTEFDYSTQYTARITLTAAGSYAFRGGFANTAAIAGFAVNGIAPTAFVSNNGTTLVFDVQFPATSAPTQIAAAPITGVTSPVAGAAPSTDIDDGTGFSASLVWANSPTAFAHSTQYTARIMLTANSGFTFSGGFTNTASIAGFTVNGIAPVYMGNTGATLTFEVQFPATAAPTPTLITAAPITGVIPPAAGAMPSKDIDDGTGFSASISWVDGLTAFDYSKQYTARITLTATSGYTFSGGFTNTASLAGFAINGTFAPTNLIHNAGATLVFDVQFPATSARTLITAAPITGVNPPVAGAAPSRDIDGGTNFTALLSWVGHPEVFAHSMQYTAFIVLTANSGFTFSGGFTNTAAIAGFTVNGIAPTGFVGNTGSTLTFQVQFPATSAPPPPPRVYHRVTYDVAGGNGTLAAAMNANALSSGAEVEQNNNVVFTAAPNDGYRVKEWRHNDTVVAGHTAETFTINHIRAAAHVTVEFEAITIPPYTGTLYFVGNALRTGDSSTAPEFPGRGTVWNAANDTLTFISDFTHISTEATALAMNSMLDWEIVIEEGVTVTLVAADAGVGGVQSRALYSRSPNLRISGSGTLNATGGAITATTGAGASTGIDAHTLTLDGATINATGGEAAENIFSIGIIANELIINSGTLTAAGHTRAVLAYDEDEDFTVPAGFNYRVATNTAGTENVITGTSNGTFPVIGIFLYARITTGPRLFTMGLDSFSFPNEHESFGITASPHVRSLTQWLRLYSIPLANLYAAQYPWEGNCYGFAASSMAFFAGDRDVTVYGQNTVYALPAPNSPTTPLAREMELYHMAQFDDRTYVDVYRANINKLNELVEAVKTFEAGGPGVIISIVDAFGGHAFNAHSIVQLAPNVYDIYAYENNWPQFFTVKLEVNLNTQFWRYPIEVNPFNGDVIYMGSEYTEQFGDYISFETMDVIQEIVDGAMTFEEVEAMILQMVADANKWHQEQQQRMNLSVLSGTDVRNALGVRAEDMADAFEMRPRSRSVRMAQAPLRPTMFNLPLGEYTVYSNEASYAGGGSYFRASASDPNATLTVNAAQNNASIRINSDSAYTFTLSHISDGAAFIVPIEITGTATGSLTAAYSAAGLTFTAAGDATITMPDGRTLTLAPGQSVLAIESGSDITDRGTDIDATDATVDTGSDILLNGHETGFAFNADGAVTISATDLAGLTAPIWLTIPFAGASNAHTGVRIHDGQQTIIPFSVSGDGYVTMLVTAPGTYGVIDNVKYFTDINGHWGAHHIVFASARGLFGGVGNDRFAPNGPMTRAMFVKVLHNLAGRPSHTPHATFHAPLIDIPADAWFASAIHWAAGIGIIGGDSANRFAPNDPITREQMAVILLAFLDYYGYDYPNVPTDPFVDEASISPWALHAVRRIHAAGIVSGKPGNRFDPQGTATRAEVAAIFSRVVHVYQAHTGEVGTGVGENAGNTGSDNATPTTFQPHAEAYVDKSAAEAIQRALAGDDDDKGNEGKEGKEGNEGNEGQL